MSVKTSKALGSNKGLEKNSIPHCNKKSITCPVCAHPAFLEPFGDTQDNDTAIVCSHCDYDSRSFTTCPRCGEETRRELLLQVWKERVNVCYNPECGKVEQLEWEIEEVPF